MTDNFHQRVIALIKKIPQGKVATYGQIAGLAGSPRAARQVVRALHSSSVKEGLPWHRVVNAAGRISLPRRGGYEEQQKLLEYEGVTFKADGAIDFDRYLWSGHKTGM
ncbi:MAG: MGMT family protein [candidate division Zixibacteria bacterium]|nr:MGMT family protein [candidate division Zixibacteria bacterium]MDH3938337.1 MGMT family protein [candidate division Zixibacteria bacterium]MDH4035693.1 MGMT family protein [candidate division Zixibacteria bacterium]